MPSARRLSVLPLTLADLSAVSELASHGIGGHPLLPSEARALEAARYQPEMLRRSTLDGENSILVARLDEHCVGFVHAHAACQVAWLQWIVVAEPFRGRNVAWYLWRKMFACLRCSGVGVVWGSILTRNERSIVMAKAMGFQIVGELPRHWHGCDYVLVSRRL